MRTYTDDDDFSKILKIKDIPTQKPKPDEVVFKVKSAALNYDDIWGMRGKPSGNSIATYIRNRCCR